MSATATRPTYAIGTALPKMWSRLQRRSTFGDVVVVLFLVTQCLDGVLTYIGVLTFGTSVEANPLLATLMTQLGQGTALLTAKLMAAVFGIVLHVYQVHLAVAALTAFYVAVAVIPWATLLFM